ncbi:indolepyruvate ferredoxin oxidoreductase subunit alpha [Sinanaerobacter chloroacetimidivorans]|uniref:Indolepyruvate oxidoreductase subunit IorA n=1 Tax=Sinanaerobacter chloroacetimidivorans TaxID=2818044 RepID=A0A8J7VXS9_9FIRM|nr:indolepyruvate ferredoxin oxidoreductase subunit alpha [Sinanaerobacter chloroacetimidivorans]MBR0597047.1 indolepyruvate ferredoxin oxidoreductase subunit alpha [Sinanaerobacter chloroacetimidivorans]
MKQLMTGNEAVARGAYEAGLAFASAYPGTPSTEILENMVQYKEDIYCEWAPNEKVALEAAIGASVAGARAMAAMKHVGVNVAADPLFTFAYTGVTGGCVLISADDPGMHSSQNEQDNRNYATAARVLMLEPSDSQEAKDYMKLGLELSEQFDTPVLLRMTTRVCHSKGLVTLEDRAEKDLIPYEHNIKKYVATPANGKVLRRKLIDRLKRMEEYSNRALINKAEYNGTKIGVISAGVAYQYAREVFGEEASYLKLGMTYPMPMDLIKEFAGKVEKLYVIEEMDPYMENHLKMAGIPCIGKEIIPEMDELNTDIVRQAVFGITGETIKAEQEAVMRPPTLCAGCPHRGIYYALSKKKNLIVTGDIGCYTLGSAPPLSSMHTCFCMGASISSGHGAATVLKRAGSDLRVASIIGDSTFFHSGITSLMDVVYNRGTHVTLILDNRITAMTGHQENPGTGYTLMGKKAVEVDIPMLCKAIGIKSENIYIINPLDLKESGDALDDALAKDEPTVLIAKWPCILKKFTEEDKKQFDLTPKSCEIDQEKCKKCKACVKTGCPAIFSGDSITINKEACTGCSVCKQVCPFDAIKEVK